ncbi:hypothetical protein EV421DRAFT_2021078 [Armillaria borealis]|uniref:Uncharacterized protein n=1 Tax=Armillaria borealis TaxID=47425 RepID=A0AA39JCD4_9AGAR|nr:hypothetical protein EV421DRAFT_2021078 [Armillaria borealis]
MQGIVDTPMLPGSMVEEADLLTSAFTMSILMAVVHTLLNGLLFKQARRQPQFPPSQSATLQTSTSPQDLMRSVESGEGCGERERNLNCTAASFPPSGLLAQRPQWWSMDKIDTALINCATACAHLSSDSGSSRQGVGTWYASVKEERIAALPAWGLGMKAGVDEADRAFIFGVHAERTEGTSPRSRRVREARRMCGGREMDVCGVWWKSTECARSQSARWEERRECARRGYSAEDLRARIRRGRVLGRGRSDAEGAVAVREVIGGGETGSRREGWSCGYEGRSERRRWMYAIISMDGEGAVAVEDGKRTTADKGKTEEGDSEGFAESDGTQGGHDSNGTNCAGPS